MSVSLPIHGRGAVSNAPNRFEPIDVVFDEDSEVDPAEAPSPKTVYLRDASRTILASNDSPDVMIEASINPYRGCEHGCVYCYARPTHEYFGLSAGLDFETKIFVKERAPELLRAELMKKSYTPKIVSMSGVTDCYQPVERKLRITRGCLEVLAAFRNPCGIVTKNHLVTRDIDLLAEMSAMNLVVVLISVTTLDKELQRLLEPRASAPARRLAAVEALAKAGVRTGIMVAPVIPGLTDHEMPAILKAAADAGAGFAGYTAVRLPFAVKDLFAEWLEKHFPDRKNKVLNHIRDIRGGKLNDSAFGTRMTGEGPMAEHLSQLFEMGKRRAGMTKTYPPLSRDLFRRPAGVNEQLGLWG